MDFSFINNADWFSLDSSTKDAVIGKSFDTTIASNPSYAQYDEPTQKALRDKYYQNAYDAEYQSEYNQKQKQSAPQIEGGFLSNSWEKLKSVYDRTEDTATLVDEVTLSSFDDTSAKDIAEYITTNRKKFTPRAERQTISDMQEMDERRWSHDPKGVFENAKAYLGSAYDIGKSVATNPEGAAYATMDSADSLMTYAVGAWAGGKAATPIALAVGSAGPQAAIPFDEIAIIGIGSAIGTITASLPSESVSYFIGKVEERLSKDGLLPTEYNISKLLKDKEFTTEAVNASRTKATTTAITDTIVGLGVGKVVTAPARKALRVAKKSLAKGTSKAVVQQAARDILKNKSLASKISGKVKGTALEIASEPISEAAGVYAAGDEQDAVGLALETIGGIGSGPMQTAVDTAAFGTKLSTASAKQVASALAPKSEKLKQTKKLTKAKAAHKFEEKIDTAIETETVDNLTKPDHADYNPIGAVTALRKLNQEKSTTEEERLTNTEKAFDLYNTHKKERTDFQVRIADLKEKEAKDLTKDEKRELRDAPKIFKEYDRTLHSLDMLSSAMVESDKPTDETSPELDSITPESDPTDIIKSFNSKSNEGKTSNFLQNAEKLEASGNTPETAKPLMAKIAELGKAYSEWRKITSKPVNESTTGKTVATVAQDVYSGGKGKIGINQHLANIAKALSNNNIGLAKKSLKQLRNFSESHQLKVDTLNAEMDDGVKHSPNFVATVASESKNIQKAASLAEEMIATKLSSNKPLESVSVETQPSTSKESETSVEAPTEAKPKDDLKVFKKNIAKATNVPGLEKSLKRVQSPEKAKIIQARLDELQNTTKAAKEKPTVNADEGTTTKPATQNRTQNTTTGPVKTEPVDSGYISEEQAMATEMAAMGEMQDTTSKPVEPDVAVPEKKSTEEQTTVEEVTSVQVNVHKEGKVSETVSMEPKKALTYIENKIKECKKLKTCLSS